MKSTDVTKKDAEVRQHLRDAVFHLLCCWDSLNAAEQADGGIIDVDDIECIAGGLLMKDDAAAADDATVQGWLDDIRADHNERRMSDD